MTPCDVLNRHTAAEIIGWGYYLDWKAAAQKAATQETERGQLAEEVKNFTMTAAAGG